MARVFNEGSRFDRKRELKERMLAWLAAKLGVGPSLGDVYYLATADGAMEANLLEMGVKSSDIFHSLYTAEDAMTSGQNDVLCVTYGTYTETAETDWDKSSTHIVGLGGPQQSGFDVGTILTTATGTVGAVIHNTGTRNQFHDITVTNSGAAATALTAFNNAGPGTRMIGCQIAGMLGATACDTALASSLQMSANGYYFHCEDTIIGTTDGQVIGADTAAPLYFVASAMVSDNYFKNCLIQGRIAAVTRVLLYIGELGCDRQLVFDGCTFYSFSVDHGTTMTQAISDANTSTHDIIIKNCAGIGMTDWTTNANMTYSSSPDAGTAGGIGVAQT